MQLQEGRTLDGWKFTSDWEFTRFGYIELFKLFEKIDELKGDIGELETTV